MNKHSFYVDFRAWVLFSHCDDPSASVEQEDAAHNLNSNQQIIGKCEALKIFSLCDSIDYYNNYIQCQANIVKNLKISFQHFWSDAAYLDNLHCVGYNPVFDGKNPVRHAVKQIV